MIARLISSALAIDAVMRRRGFATHPGESADATRAFIKLLRPRARRARRRSARASAEHARHFAERYLAAMKIFRVARRLPRPHRARRRLVE